jgi:hypothetical protein
MPYDVLMQIMALLDPYDLCSVSQVCSVRFSIPHRRLSVSYLNLNDAFTLRVVSVADASRGEQRRFSLAPLLQPSIAFARGNNCLVEGAVHELAAASTQAILGVQEYDSPRRRERCCVFSSSSTSTKFNFSDQQARGHTWELQRRMWVQLLPTLTICSSSSCWETRVCVALRSTTHQTGYADS